MNTNENETQKLCPDAWNENRDIIIISNKDGITDAINIINKEIDTLQMKKQFLIQLREAEFVDYDMWRKILDTPLSRNTNALLNVLQKTFPGAINGNYSGYCFEFLWKDIEISLPLFPNETVSIDTDWFYKQPDILTEKTTALVEELIPILNKFGTNVRQWGVKSNPSENGHGLDRIKEMYYTEKEKREEEHVL